MRVIDMECSVPKLATGNDDTPAASATSPVASVAQRPAGYGMANYERIFRSRRDGGDTRPDTKLSAWVGLLERAGIVRALPFGASNDEVAELLRDYPDRFIGLARISALHGMRGVRELEFRVREQKFVALGVSALVDGIPASDRRFYPLYAKAVELGIPARIYSSMNYATDRPYDLGHPRHLDQVAIDFPELTIIGGLGGWPWVNEMVALVRRHPRLDADVRKAPLDDAYRIQDALHRLMTDAGRGEIAGWKIALTSKAMQQMTGVDQPAAGAIFSKVVHPSPARLDVAAYHHLGVEFEVAVRDRKSTRLNSSHRTISYAV